MTVGGLLKLSGDIHGWANANLREVDIIDGFYFLKIDGRRSDNQKPEQIQIFLRSHDAASLVAGIEKLILTKGSDEDKRILALHRELVSL